MRWWNFIWNISRTKTPLSFYSYNYSYNFIVLWEGVSHPRASLQDIQTSSIVDRPVHSHQCTCGHFCVFLCQDEKRVLSQIQIMSKCPMNFQPTPQKTWFCKCVPNCHISSNVICYSNLNHSSQFNLNNLNLQTKTTECFPLFVSKTT